MRHQKELQKRPATDQQVENQVTRMTSQVPGDRSIKTMMRMILSEAAFLVTAVIRGVCRARFEH